MGTYWLEDVDVKWKYKCRADRCIYVAANHDAQALRQSTKICDGVTTFHIKTP